MNILVISNMYPSAKDPVYGTFVKVFYRFFAEHNTGKTRLIAIKGRTNSPLQKLWNYISFYARVIFALLFHTYDVVYVHTIAFTAPPIRFAAFFRRLPLVLNVHGGDVLTHTSTAEHLKALARPLVLNAQMVVAPSLFFKDVLLKEFHGLSPDRIFISPSGGIDIKRFTPATCPKTSEPVLGYVSRIDKGKGWDIFLQAIATLQREGIGVKGLIAGRGAQTEELKVAIREKNLTEVVDYVGPVPHDELPSFYQQFDLFIFPTCLYESLGLVGIEAMACGVPVIGSDIAALKGYIIPGKNGDLFPVGNVEALVESIKTYINLNPSQRQSYSACARETALKYDTGSIMKALFDRVKQITKP